LTVSGVDLHLDRVGEGPVVVFTHGFGDSSETWEQQRAALGQSLTTVTWDLRGHGQSGAPADVDYTRAAALEDLRAVVGIAPVVLVGHSFGGYLSLLLAIESPELVLGLALIATGPGFRDASARTRWNEHARKLGSSFDVPPESVGLVLQQDSVVIDGVGAVDCPVVNIVGGDDESFHPGHSYLGRTLPSARSIVVPEAGHMVHCTRPREVSREIARLV
jgi:pimeloyl-ACP methyl ester carboxylesterase